MKISFRSTRRAADRKAAKANKGNPIAEQARIAVDLLDTHLSDYMKKQQSKAVPLSVVNLYTGIIVKGAKGGADSLQRAEDIKLHGFIVKEIEVMLGIFGASCLKYSNEYGTENVPKEVMGSFFDQVRKRINN